MSQENKFVAAHRYREKFTPNVSRLFEKILLLQPDNRTQLHLLVIGAGNFPSYHALCEKLSTSMPHLTDIFFVLVEPLKDEIDFFLQHFATRTNQKPGTEKPRIHFSMHYEGLQSFLKSASPKKFDIIYFEHPETLILPIFLAKLGISRYKRMIELREAIPFLTQVINQNTLIIATCMSRSELKQLESLLQFSFGRNPKKIVSNPLHIFYGGPYSEGLSIQIREFRSCPHEQKKRLTSIRRCDSFLCLMIVVALATYIFYCSQHPDPEHSPQRLLAILLMGAQLYLHRPGKYGLVIKLFLYIMQLAL